MENKAKRSRGASFLKVLEGDFSKQMLIPSVFANNFNKELPHWLIIEVAGTRKCWRVDIEEKNGGLYFTDGWDDFVEAHTLEVGNYLLFAYKGQFVLEVMIYDKDGFEKPAAGQTSRFEDCKAEDYERQHKICKTHHAKETETCIRKLSANQQDVHEEQKQVVDSINKKTTKVSIAEKAVGFSVAWRETGNSCYLTIPKEVVTETNLSSKEGMVLKDQEGKSWPIELTTRQNGCVDLTQGWREFLSANQIIDGDTLTFEISSDNQILVHVAKASLIDHPSQHGEHCRIKTIESLDNPSQHAEPAANSTGTKKAPEDFGIIERVCSKLFRRSSFSKTWRKTSKNSYLYIPLKVAKEQNLQNKKRVVLCDQEGTQWQLKVKTAMDGSISLTEGWPEFRRRQEIVPGDTLNFEFVSDGMMKVNIDRAPQVDCALEWVAVKQEMEIN